MGGKLTQAPATPSLVESLRSPEWGEFRSVSSHVLCREAADALEAQQARIAELEVENERLRLTMLGGEDVAGFASSLPLAQVLDSFRTYETALRDSANSAQALADRYEKLLREAAALFRFYETSHLAKKTQDGDEKAYRNAEIAGRIEAALSSQGRCEGEQDSSSRSQPCGVGPSDLTDPQPQHSDGGAK